MKPKRPKNPDYPENTEKPYVSSFSVADYLKRTEEAYLKILEEQEPFEYELVLWWGLDGLRLNKDGTTEWISRRKKVDPVAPHLPGPIIPSPISAFTPPYPTMCGLYNSNFAPQFNYLNMQSATQSTQFTINQLDQMRQAMMNPSNLMDYLIVNRFLETQNSINETCCNAPRERRW